MMRARLALRTTSPVLRHSSPTLVASTTRSRVPQRATALPTISSERPWPYAGAVSILPGASTVPHALATAESAGASGHGAGVVTACQRRTDHDGIPTLSGLQASERHRWRRPRDGTLRARRGHVPWSDAKLFHLREEGRAFEAETRRGAART